MKRRALMGALAGAAVSGLVAGCGGGDAELRNGVVTLSFQSLAYQKPTITAVKKIVSDWNKANPKIQVTYQQGSWDAVHDQLVTQFAGGTAPTIIHDEAADIAGFAQQGFLADLGPYLSPDVKANVPKGILDTVTTDGKTYAAPTLLQSYVVFANTDLLQKQGVTVPTGGTMSWETLAAAAKQATKGGVYGLGWGLKQPTAAVMSLALNFGGKFFTGAGQDAKVSVGDAETQVPKRIHDMAYVDKSIALTTLTQSGTDILPDFYAGKYAMIVAGSYVAQQITEEAPKTFHWQVLPGLAGTSPNQAADPQTLSVSATSKHIPEATQFINYFMKAQNLAAVGQGDWLIPTTGPARDAISQATGGKSGWSQTLAGATSMTDAPFQSVTNYPRWKDQIATPAFQQYLGNKITLDQLTGQLTKGWSQVNQ
ncbi:ABC transporter substrate-binding protein [Fodinicola feengrottensis]|uniref:Sugar ABC transporter substrate-binding protein n=1 Tax=Fodinicola feengrottensis TaxID=435914 RepID=A0ABP4RNS0_9ACTN|nr:extracellular solute-binding protein [Fodinicola feengrottensis]